MPRIRMNTKRHRVWLVGALLGLLVGADHFRWHRHALGNDGATAQVVMENKEEAVIRNRAVWRDSDGKIIDCHEGAIQRAGDRFYWYGRTYRGNVDGIYGTNGAKFRCGFVCYSSADLVHWKNEGDILTYTDAPKDLPWMLEGTWHRPRMIFNARTGHYVLWYFVLGIPNGVPWSKNVVAVADRPTGPFRIAGQAKVGGMQLSGDLATFLDDDGRGYLADGDWNWNCWVLPLAEDLRDTVGERTMMIPAVPEKHLRYEGVCLGRYKGKYIAAASHVQGLNPSDSTLAVADQPLGPWRVKGEISEQKTWNSQIGSFFYLKESDTLIVLCDQWLRGPKGERVPAAESCQLWIPLKFDAKTEQGKLDFREAWNPWTR